MTKDQVNKLLSAMETAEIDKFSVVDDTFVRYYNDGVCGIIKPDTSNELFVCIAANNQGGSHKAFGSNLTVTSVDFTDMHEFVVGGDYEKISNFVEALGVELSDDDKKLIIEIDKRNYNIIPETGDYHRFVYLTEAQYDALTDEQKAEYDAAKEAYEKEKASYVGQNMAARITL